MYTKKSILGVSPMGNQEFFFVETMEYARLQARLVRVSVSSTSVFSELFLEKIQQNNTRNINI